MLHICSHTVISNTEVKGVASAFLEKKKKGLCELLHSVSKDSTIDGDELRAAMDVCNLLGLQRQAETFRKRLGDGSIKRTVCEGERRKARVQIS